jgi:hypothetical protein
MVTLQAHQARSPFAQHAIAPGGRLELLFLVQSKLALEAALTIFERGHGVPKPALPRLSIRWIAGPQSKAAPFANAPRFG